MATVFTKIIRGEIPSYKVAEDDRFYAFLDINPLAAGHTLVVPKFDSVSGGDVDVDVDVDVDAAGDSGMTHELDYIFDLDDATLGAMMVFAKHVAVNIRAATGCARVAVVVLGLEVPHVHIHLIPINSEADVDFRAPRLKLTTEQFAALAASIRQNDKG
jgi:histidine triad (HIT) family protein